MENIPFVIARLQAPTFLILFGLCVMIVTAGVTSVVWSVMRWHYMMNHGDKELTEYVTSLESRLADSEQSNKTLSKEKAVLRGKLEAARSVME